jgi:hypothetical protein
MSYKKVSLIVEQGVYSYYVGGSKLPDNVVAAWVMFPDKTTIPTAVVKETTTNDVWLHGSFFVIKSHKYSVPMEVHGIVVNVDLHRLKIDPETIVCGLKRTRKAKSTKVDEYLEAG